MPYQLLVGPRGERIRDVRMLDAQRVCNLVERVRAHNLGVSIDLDRHSAPDAVARCHNYFEDVPICLTGLPASFVRRARDATTQLVSGLLDATFVVADLVDDGAKY